MSPSLSQYLFQNNSMQGVMASSSASPTPSITSSLTPSSSTYTPSRSRSVRVQALPLGAAAPGPSPPFHLPPHCGQSQLPLYKEPKHIKLYFANITCYYLPRQKHILATNYINKFHLLGLLETHVVDRQIFQQFSKTLGRQSFQRPAVTTTGRYSSGGEAIMPLNFLSVFPLPRSLVQDLPFVICQLRVRKVTILVAVFYARPGECHKDILSKGCRHWEL